MNPYDRPPGSSRCPHGDYYFKKINAIKTEMYCGLCNELAGWYEDSQPTAKFSISDEELELLR